MKQVRSIISIMSMVALSSLSGCSLDDDSLESNESPPNGSLPTDPQTVPEAFNLTNVSATSGKIKTFSFSWSESKSADTYTVCLKNEAEPDNCSILASGVKGLSTEAVFNNQYLNTQSEYFILAKNQYGQQLSNELSISSSELVSAVGYFKASNTDAYDSFGNSVALSGDGNTLVVGASEEDSNAVGVNSDESNNASGSSGAVYVFERNEGEWSQIAYLKASNTDSGDGFGGSVVVNYDGTTIAVSAVTEDSTATGINGVQGNGTPVNKSHNSGAVYVFKKVGVNWSQEAYLKASNQGASDYFGTKIALSNDGLTLVASAVNEDTNSSDSGAVYVFSRSSGNWVEQAMLKASNADASDRFGTALSISGDGLNIAVSSIAESSNSSGIGGDESDNSSSHSGAVYVFSKVGASWNQTSYIKASNSQANDRFGVSISLNNDGTYMAVGSTGEDSNATGMDGDRSNNSMNGSGAVYIYKRDGVNWTEQSYIKPSYTFSGLGFGETVALTGDASTLLVTTTEDSSKGGGFDVDQTNQSGDYVGVAYVFEREGVQWSQSQMMQAPVPQNDYIFGWATSISDTKNIAIASPEERSASTGVGGDQTDSSASRSGAVFIY